MKHVLPSALAATALLIGAATTAGPLSPDLSSAFGATAVQITAIDMEADARHLFEVVDQDQSGSIDGEEFAAHAVVLAELARLNGTVTVEGAETTKRITLPTGTARTVSAAERTSLNAVARREFFVLSGNGQELSGDDFMSYRVSLMTRVDQDRSGSLEGRELGAYARAVARPVSAGA